MPFAGKHSLVVFAEPLHNSGTGNTGCPSQKDGQLCSNQRWRLLACREGEILYPFRQQYWDPIRNRRFYDSAATRGHLHVAVPHCFEIRAVDTWQITADRRYREEKALPPKYHISYCCALNKSVSCPFQRSERHAGQNFKLWQSDLITSVLFSLHKPLIQQHVIKSSFAWKALSDHKVFCSTVLFPSTA